MSKFTDTHDLIYYLHLTGYYGNILSQTNYPVDWHKLNYDGMTGEVGNYTLQRVNVVNNATRYVESWQAMLGCVRYKSLA